MKVADFVAGVVDSALAGSTCRTLQHAANSLAVIVCGGRDYANRDHVYRELDRLLRTVPDASHMLVIQGGAKVFDRERKEWVGADLFARQWAEARGVPHEEYPADWEREGKRAGPLRNYRMLDVLKSKACARRGVVRFPGGRGTSHMAEIARNAGLVVHEA